MTPFEAKGALEDAPGEMAARGRLRVGVDVVSIAAVEASMRRFGERYTHRLFSERELSDTAGSAQAAGLAARFAAKEATIKALEPDVHPLGWRTIEILRLAGGRCVMDLHGPAAHLAESAGIDEWALSMSHEGPVAVAVVVGTGPGKR